MSPTLAGKLSAHCRAGAGSVAVSGFGGPFSNSTSLIQSVAFAFDHDVQLDQIGRLAFFKEKRNFE